MHSRYEIDNAVNESERIRYALNEIKISNVYAILRYMDRGW